MRATFRCGHGRTPENTLRRPRDGYAHCALCYQVRLINAMVTAAMHRMNRAPAALTLGEKIVRGLA